MFDRSKVKPIGTKLGACVVFSRAEIAKCGDSYIQHAIRNSAAGVVDEIARKYTKRVEAERGELLGVEYRLNVTVLTSDELDELAGQAYSAGVEAGAKFGMTTWRPADEA